MALGRLVPAGLGERLQQGVELVASARRARILCHYDADGTTAAAILSAALLRRGLPLHVSLSTVLDRELVQAVGARRDEVVLVSDMGSGQLSLLEELPAPVVVLDHHAPPRDSDKVVHANPHLFGIDGTKGACGATVSFLFALALDDGNWDLVGPALAGAIADRQHVGGFQALNEAILSEATAKHLVEVERGVALRDLPLGEAVAAAVDPYFVGLSGRKDAAERWLREAGLNPDARLRDLSPAERRTLTSALSLHLLRQGARPETVETTLVESKYWLPRDGVYAGELSENVNACARLGHQATGLALCLGDPEAGRRAEEFRSTYMREMQQGLQRLERERPFKKKRLQFFYAENATLAGALCGIGMQFFFDGERPTLALTVTDGKTKVSSRGTSYLVGRGLDLAKALREAAEAVGGSGGGHNIASGATIPKGKEEKFLELVDGVVDQQLAVKAAA